MDVLAATSSNFVEFVENNLFEGSDNEIFSDCEDNSEILSEQSDQVHLSELSDDEVIPANEEADDSPRGACIRGKNGHHWSTDPPIRGQTARRNIVVRVPGNKGEARNIATIQTIQKVNYSSDSWYLGNTTCNELYALFGLLYTAGVLKSGHLSSREMWSAMYGVPLYRFIMPENRFMFLLNCLRFDDRTARDEHDKFSPIRALWNMFISNCKSSYTPHAYCTVDEQLLSFRGRCPFKVYIFSKPDKYVLKIVCMCDSRTYYMVNAIPYIGKEHGQRDQNQPLRLVKEITEPIHGTGRNITADNWFMSIPLADTMLTDFNLTVVGTLRKNKREIPPSFLPSRKTAVLSSNFAFDQQKTIVSFCPKRGKSVILLSTMHGDKAVNEETKKPEMIHFYNETKGGIDTFDQLNHTYSVARKTRRWPLRFFYGILDQAGVNALVLFKNKHTEQTTERRSFLKDLGLQLARPFMEERLKKPLPKDLQEGIKKILGITLETPDPNPARNKPKQARCSSCPRSKDRKTKTFCAKCHSAICTEHKYDVCKSCFN